MIIGLLAALMVYLFGGGGQETIFLDQQVQKNVKTYVSDKSRKKEIFQEIDLIKKDQKDFLKKRKNYYAGNASKLNLNFSAKREDFDKLFGDYFDERKKLQSSYIDHELKIRTLIKEEEWEKIVASALDKPDNVKARKSYLKLSEKLFGDVQLACGKTILDSKKSEEARGNVLEVKAEVDRFVNEFLDLNYKDLEPLRKLTASRSDFESLWVGTNDLRKKILANLISMRFKLAAMSTEKEWKKLGKELDKLFTNGKSLI
ncbi:MAG: hypothetical protein PSX36_12020 [bacterium]|nr:hypothetical protein [bacterium]